jgi:predicted metal-dependent hydrolase
MLVVRSGRFVPKWYINRFVKSKEKWILDRLEKSANQPQQPIRTPHEIQLLSQEATLKLVPIIELWSRKIGVKYSKISFRNQKTRWGSCSSRGALSFNIRLVNMPEDIMEYVVIHELCHLVEHNHSARFWSLVTQYCPEYKEKVKWLKTNQSMF